MKKMMLTMLVITLAVLSWGDIVINEIMYNTPGYDNEWIELYNTGTSAVDLTDWWLIDNDPTHQQLDIPGGSIPAGGYFTIVIDQHTQADPLPFTPDYNGTGTHDWNLGNGNDEVNLYDSSDTLIDHVNYDDGDPWPTSPDGDGPSLELNDPALDNELPASWHASEIDGGTPGAENTEGGGGGDFIQVANIAELRSHTPGSEDIFEITGEVILTFQQGFRNQKYIQDDTGAILIDDCPTGNFFDPGYITTTYNIYDGITGITGTLGEYGGMYQLVPVEGEDPGAPTSTGNTVTPEEVEMDELFSNFDEYEAKLVIVMDMNFTTTGTFENGAVYPISDPTGSGDFRATFYDVDYIGTDIPSSQVNLIGLPNSRTDGEFITARFSADLNFNPNDPALSVNPPNASFGSVEYGVEYEMDCVLTNTGGSELTIDQVAISHSDVETDLVTPINIAPDGEHEFTITLVPSEHRDILYEETITFTGNFGTYVMNVTYTIPTPAEGVIINEIMYNSTSYDNEWFELYNADENPVDISGWYFLDDDPDHVPVTFPDGTTIPAQSYFTVALYHDSQAEPFPFTADFDCTDIADFNLNNAGDEINLYNAAGELMDAVAYFNDDPWPTAPDGNGPSLELIDPALDNTLPESWQGSVDMGGSPGAPNSGGASEFDMPTLAQLRQQDTGSNIYRVTGEVVLTYQQDWRGQKYVQDDTAAILIDDNNGVIATAYQIGDGITNLTGTLGEYGGMLQFTPTEDPGAPTSTGNTIAPEVITMQQLVDNFEDYEAELVKIWDVSFADTGVFENGMEYGISDPDGVTATFRTTFYDMDYIGTDIPTDPVHLVGLCNSRSEGEYITSRFLSDLIDAQDAEDGQVAPLEYRLMGNYPNPFNPVTAIRFSLPEAETVSLMVYDIRGRLVRTLVNERLDSGVHEIVWHGDTDNGKSAATGIYLCRMKAGSYTDVRRMILMK